MTFAYITGWRVPSEVLRLQWRQVDFKGGTIRLDPGSTKNGEGRMFPMTAERRALLEEQREVTREFERSRGVICKGVLHRNGTPIRDFRTAWRLACDAAGCPDRTPHDFRRTAVRNFEQRGISRSVATKLTGHKTESARIHSATSGSGAVPLLSRRADPRQLCLTCPAPGQPGVHA